MSVIVEFYIPEKERKNTVKTLATYFSKNYTEDIEEGIYEYTEQYCMSNPRYKLLSQAIYNDMKKNILYNCEQNNQTIKKIKKDMKKKKFNPYNLAFLRPEELDEDNWMRIIMRKNTTEEKLNNLPTVTWKPCYRCKCTQYSFYQLQTRSVDEPMTTFYICKQCDKNYSVNV